MVDAARQMLDELMGRHRNKDPSEKVKKVNWDDPEFCQYYMVKFCPHDLFVNTRADLGPCPKLHDDEAKRMYEEARKGARKRQFEDDFIRFCNNMINEVDRKIQKGRQRLLLMNRGEGGGVGGPVYISKYQEQLNNLNARIKKLLTEAEEAGHRGDVDQAQGLTTLCEQLKDEKEALLAQHDSGATAGPTTTPAGNTTPGTPTSQSAIANPVAATGEQKTTSNIPHWATDLNGQQEKQMEVCEVCGAFLIVGDAQQRIEDHLTGKQHLGYARVRKAIDEMHEQRQKEREEDDKRRDEDRKVRTENGIEKRRSSSERNRDRDNRDHRSSRDDDKRRGFGREYDRRDRDRNRYDRRGGGGGDNYRGGDRDRRVKDTSSRHDRRDNDRRERPRRDNNSRKRSRSRSHSRR